MPSSGTSAILRRMDEQGHVLPFPQAPDGIELRHLRAFVAVAEELDFARRGPSVSLGAALSRQIRGFEQLIGSELLRRSTHNVELTIAGEALLERAREILRGVDAAVVATLAAGGESLARVTKLWEPMVGLLDSEDTLEEARAVGEQLLAQFAPPPDTECGQPPRRRRVTLCWFRAGPDTAPTVLYIHGGAFVSDSAFGYRTNAGALATAAQTGVLVPDYRLAPEHPFRAPLEDCLRAYRWLLERCAPERLSLAGDSSGASLVLSLLLTLKEEGEPLPGAVVLQCPVVDLSLRLGRDPGETPLPSPPATKCGSSQPCTSADIRPTIRSSIRFQPISRDCQRCSFRPRQATGVSPMPRHSPLGRANTA